MSLYSSFFIYIVNAYDSFPSLSSISRMLVKPEDPTSLTVHKAFLPFFPFCPYSSSGLLYLSHLLYIKNVLFQVVSSTFLFHSLHCCQNNLLKAYTTPYICLCPSEKPLLSSIVSNWSAICG